MSENRRDKVNRKRNIINSKLTKLLLSIVVIAIVFSIFLIFNKDKLYGSWSTDGNTIYTFNGKGEGTLLTSVSKYNFTYKIKKNQVYIDFKVQKAKDSDYEFSIKDGNLVLKGINKTTGTYTLKKK